MTDDRYKTVKVYSEKQKELIAMHDAQAKSGHAIMIEAVGAPEEEEEQLRSLTNEELWQMKDRIDFIKRFLDRLVEDCFEFRESFGWRIKE